MSDPQQEQLQELLDKKINNSQDVANDNIPDKSVNDVNIPDDELTDVVLSDFLNDMRDKEDSGFTEKLTYDLKAYHGIKDEFMQTYPFDGASAYPIPITPVQIDTAWSMLDDLNWRNPNKVVCVNPVGLEDRIKAKNLEWLLNWQCINDIPNMQMEDSASNFLMLLHGTSYEKVLRTNADKYQLGISNAPIENMYLPIDARSPDIEDTDHVIQLIPLGVNDMRQRLQSGVYRNLDKVSRGFVPGANTSESLESIRKEVMALDGTNRISRDTWYIGEYYKTYYPKGSSRRIELIVHFAPSTGAILRKIINTENMRPFVDKYIYPNYGKCFHMSLPWKIKNIQDKANYTDKQCVDGIDKAISPAGFYDGTEQFDPRVNMRAPTSMYKMQNAKSITWEPINIAPILAQRTEIKNLWLEAERLTGFTDLNQGISTSASANTLGQDQMRSNRAAIRFNRIAKLMNYHWGRKMKKIFQYDDIYMPRETKIKVIGVNRYDTIEKLFPRDNVNADGANNGIGLVGKYDFSIANKSMDQQELENRKRISFYGSVIAHPIFGQDVGNAYRALEQQAEASEIYDFDNTIKRPKEAMQLTPDEVVARLWDGENVAPDPNVDFALYITEIESFMRTGNFKDSSPDIQKNFVQYLLILNKMKQASILAFQDHSMIAGLKNQQMQNQQNNVNQNKNKQPVNPNV